MWLDKISKFFSTIIVGIFIAIFITILLIIGGFLFIGAYQVWSFVAALLGV